MEVRKWIPAGLTLIVLGTVGWNRATLPNHDAADALAAEVRLVKDQIPDRIGGWVAKDVEPQQAAVKLLRPNILFQRVYFNPETKERVTVLVVHTRDIRDMIGHFPPVCYPGQGWTLQSKHEVPVKLVGKNWTGMEYEFDSSRSGGDVRLHVTNFILLPLTGVSKDMNDLSKMYNAIDRRYFGGGQVQIVCDNSIPPDRRNEIVLSMMNLYEPLFDAILGMKENHATATTQLLSSSHDGTFGLSERRNQESTR